MQQLQTNPPESGCSPVAKPFDIWDSNGFDETIWNLFFERFKVRRAKPQSDIYFYWNTLDKITVEFSGILWVTTQWSNSVSTMPFELQPCLPHVIMGYDYIDESGRWRPLETQGDTEKGRAQLLPSHKQTSSESDDDMDASSHAVLFCA